MFKLVVLSVILAGAFANEALAPFLGASTPVAVIPQGDAQKGCVEFKLDETRNSCQCQGLNLNSILLTTPEATTHIPVLIARTAAEAAADLKSNCKCNGEHPPVFRSLNNNYFVYYGNVAGEDVKILHAKRVPSEAELRDFLQSVEELRDAYITCSK